MPRNDIQMEPQDGEETCKWTIEVIAKVCSCIKIVEGVLENYKLLNGFFAETLLPNLVLLAA